MAAALAALLCAGCTAPAGGGRSSGGTQSSGDGHPVTDAQYSSVSAASSAGDEPAETTPVLPPSTTQASITGPNLPGGSRGADALAAAGDLTGDGRVELRRPSGAGEPTDTGADLCDFLFGSPADIADITRLTGDLTLDPISGRHRSGADPVSAATTGTDDMGEPDAAQTAVIACVYRAGGAPVLALQVGDGPPVDPDLPGQPTIVDADGLHAVLSYSPDHIGATIDPATARAWLTAVIGRVALAGSG